MMCRLRLRGDPSISTRSLENIEISRPGVRQRSVIRDGHRARRTFRSLITRFASYLVNCPRVVGS
jgi:hypothetical protein